MNEKSESKWTTKVTTLCMIRIIIQVTAMRRLVRRVTVLTKVGIHLYLLGEHRPSLSDPPPLPEVQRRISARRKGNTDLDAYNIPSTSSATISMSSTSATTLTSGNYEPSLSGTTSGWLKQKLDSIEWHMPTREGPTPMEYTGPISGFKEIYSGILANASPIEYFDLFVTNDIIQHIVDQTNLYATQQLLSNDIPSGSRQHAWVPRKRLLLKWCQIIAEIRTQCTQQLHFN